jgi:hypothetical protein
MQLGMIRLSGGVEILVGGSRFFYILLFHFDKLKK